MSFVNVFTIIYSFKSKNRLILLNKLKGHMQDKTCKLRSIGKYKFTKCMHTLATNSVLNLNSKKIRVCSSGNCKENNWIYGYFGFK